MNKIYLILSSLLFVLSSYGQNYEVVNHNYENFHDFPQLTSFAEDADGSIWVMQRGGFTGDVISLYKDDEWSSVSFDFCSNCTYRITSDNEGVIYLATNIGFFAFIDDTWVEKSGDVISSAEIDFDSVGNVWFTSNDDPRRLANVDPTGDVTRIDEIQGGIEEMTVSDNNMVWLYNDGQIKSYSDGVVNTYDQSADHLAVDGENNLWYIDFTGKVGKIIDGEIISNQIPNAINSFQAISFEIDRKNNLLYMGQQGFDAGVMMVNLTEGTNQFINSDDMFPDEVGLVSSLFAASNGTLWAASDFSPNIAEVKIDIVSSVEDQLISFDIFPNPTSTTLSIDNTSEANVELTIISLKGQIMNRVLSTLGVIEVDVTSYPSGTYLVGNRVFGFKKIQIVK